MALGNEELFVATMEAMETGDSLMIMGGTFPGPDDSAEIMLGMQAIIPLLQIVTGSDRHPTRVNPFVGQEDPIELTLERGDKRFGHEPALDIAIGNRAGTILGREFDLVVVGFGKYHFVSKPSPK